MSRATSQQLREVLEAIELMEVRRDLLIAKLTGTATQDTEDQVEREKRSLRKPPSVAAAVIEADRPLTADEAMAVYEAGLPKVTEAQGRMIFALLTNDHAILADEDKKAVIRGIVKEEHGVDIESTKELSKVWAGDVITYIQKAKTEDLKKFWEKEEAF